MDRDRAASVVAMFAGRGQLERIIGGVVAAKMCLERADVRLQTSISLLAVGTDDETTFTTAYDAYRGAAEAMVFLFDHRVPAVKGSHRVAMDVAHAALQDVTSVYTPATAEQFRQQRHASEYFDPVAPADKSHDDASWAVDIAAEAVSSVRAVIEAETT